MWRERAKNNLELLRNNPNQLFKEIWFGGIFGIGILILNILLAFLAFSIFSKGENVDLIIFFVFGMLVKYSIPAFLLGSFLNILRKIFGVFNDQKLLIKYSIGITLSFWVIPTIIFVPLLIFFIYKNLRNK